MQPGAIAAQAPARAPAGAPPDADGIVLGAGPVRVDAYIDFLCPFCRQFEERSGPALNRLLDGGAITLVYHPLGFLDRLSTTRYSSRASAASGCASDFGRFREYKDALFANQPPEGGPRLRRVRGGRRLPALERVRHPAGCRAGSQRDAQCLRRGRSGPSQRRRDRSRGGRGRRQMIDCTLV
jgi:hypothetical protein